ncbi:hypothetical protein WMY93_030682 [Mugilogobius chulae]|uniref:Uncharacterized protein n=1 Tax=Mugilogobius chulae TaxID=88201 RepID=A0AAW0MTH9_9GOBI
MATYQVTVFTGNLKQANTFNNVYIKLVGEAGESERTWLQGQGFVSGKESSFTVSCAESLGDLILVEVDKQEVPLFPQDSWFVDKVEVKSPEGKVFKFPLYYWINDDKIYSFREGKALKVSEERHPSAKSSREKELAQRKEEYCWALYEEGMPYSIKGNDPFALPPEIQFSLTNMSEFSTDGKEGLVEMKLVHLVGCEEPWADFDSLYRAFSCSKTDISDYVQKNWKDDAFFGYQFLNSLNPIEIRLCTSLPTKFPVSEDMVALEGGASLKEEMQKGNIFLCDYKILDGVKTRIINGKAQYLAAPLVLLHKTSDDELKPVAIQLKQTPATDNPIFVPSDSEYDWLLAKTFVRSAEGHTHELISHLLRTHLLGEVFTVSLLRNLPRVHPLYKLIFPHTRFNLQVNIRARHILISENGILTRTSASGGEGMATILQRALSSMTYSSLCLPEDIKERGMGSLPNYYYRDDGLRIWDIINRFVKGIINHYYKSDKDVQEDSELQDYIREIFEYGFLSKTESEIPQSFSTVDELVKFVTMVIFTMTAQHSAVNSGQWDYGGWIPNFPSTLKVAPPTVKGEASERTLLEALPDVNVSVLFMVLLWVLSKQSPDMIAFGRHPYELFTEDVCCKLIKEFQKELSDLDEAIDARNKNLKLPYTYLLPKSMENSVSI